MKKLGRKHRPYFALSPSATTSRATPGDRELGTYDPMVKDRRRVTLNAGINMAGVGARRRKSPCSQEYLRRRGGCRRHAAAGVSR